MNPIFFAIATMLVLAWKTAGRWGPGLLGLPEFGTPRRLGPLFARRPAVSVIR